MSSDSEGTDEIVKIIKQNDKEIVFSREPDTEFCIWLYKLNTKLKRQKKSQWQKTSVVIDIS